MKLKYLGHSAFEISILDYKILIDPFLIKCPDYDYSKTTDIFVTHGHSDHLGDSIKISKETNATITGVFELANYCAEFGAKTRAISLGGWIDYSWGRVIAVFATHSSSFEQRYLGAPVGYIFDIDGIKIYHSGDTGLNYEMKLIGELYAPEYSLLPIGGNYTMDIEHCAIASKFLKTKNVIPMHYNTFDAIEVDVSDFEKSIKEVGLNPIILDINQEIEI